MANLKLISLEKIRLDGGTQVREGLSEKHIARLIASVEAGRELPAVDLFFDGSTYWMGDGFHRWHVASRLGHKTLLANVHSGSAWEARHYASGCNHQHGLPLEDGDRRNAIRMALTTEDGESSPLWSKPDANIADHCKCSRSWVAAVRNEIIDERRLKEEARTSSSGSSRTVVCRSPGGGTHERKYTRVAAVEATRKAEEKQELLDDIHAMTMKAAKQLKMKTCPTCKGAGVVPAEGN